MDTLTFGHTLRMLRTTAGISLREMAKRIHVSPAYLSQVELGKQLPPTHDRIAEIAETIGIPVSLLFEMSHRTNPDILFLLQGRHELNELIKSTTDIGLRTRDILEIIALMRELGGSGFRKLICYGVNHSSDFKQPGSGNFYSDAVCERKRRIEYSELVNPRLVFKSLDFNEKGDLLRFLMEKIGSIYHSFNVDKAYDKLVVREAGTSSGLGNGVAIPHLFVNDLDGTIITIGRVPEGVDFNAIDKNAVYFVCLILSNQKDYQSHLNLLAFLARRFQHPTFMNELIKAKSKKHIVSLLFNIVPSMIN